MHVIRTESDLQGLKDPDPLDMIRRRIEDTAEYVDHFGELVFFVVVEPGDGIAALDDALGFSPLINRFDDSTYGSANFTPSWDVLEEHPGFYELVYVLSDDGQGVTLLVTKAEGVPADLLSMCRQFAPSQVAT